MTSREGSVIPYFGNVDKIESTQPILLRTHLKFVLNTVGASHCLGFFCDDGFFVKGPDESFEGDSSVDGNNLYILRIDRQALLFKKTLPNPTCNLIVFLVHLLIVCTQLVSSIVPRVGNDFSRRGPATCRAK